jgi:periplasmic protein TonB
VPLRRRASGIALALGINALLLVVLLGIGAMRFERPKKAQGSIVFDLSPEATTSAAKQPRETARKVRPRKRPVPPLPPRLPVEPPAVPKADWLEMTRDEYAAADISKLPKFDNESGAAKIADSEEVGRGPRGEILYAAEWARKPTDAELSGYLPANAPDGWGLIACRTIPGNRVDDCVELGNSPRGSRLASAVRQAAWQFRVRPPRKNGRELVGEWVQIRIDYIRTERSASN